MKNLKSDTLVILAGAALIIVFGLGLILGAKIQERTDRVEMATRIA